MSDFSKPEYASYVALCRKLRLERGFQEGDLYTPGIGYRLLDPRHTVLRHGGPDHAQFDGIPSSTEERGKKGKQMWAWLPQFSDWLDMLEAAGCRVIRTHDMRDHLGYRVAWDEPNGYAVTAPTREEAAARLWNAVTGRTA